jgi:hypothetical protein
VKAAEGHPSHALQLLLWTYDVLEGEVYSTFVRNSDRLGLLVELKEVCDTYHKSTPILRSDNFWALKLKPTHLYFMQSKEPGKVLL